jgi:hypothetical protein
MSLYNLSQQYLEVLDESINDETGEINEQAIARLEEVKESIDSKGVAIASYIKNIEAERDAIEKAKKEMSNRERRLDNKMSYLTDYLLTSMEKCGIQKISCPHFEIKVKKCPPSVDITDSDLIPEECKVKEVTIHVNKRLIKENLSKGINVPGAMLKHNLRLEIK